MRRRQKVLKSEGSSNYLASVSDIMSGLIFIFIITLMVFAIQLKGMQNDAQDKLEKLEKEKKELQIEKEKYKIKTKELEKKILELVAEKKILERIVKELTGSKALRARLLLHVKNSLNKNGFKVKIDIEHGVLSLPVEILFSSGSATISMEGDKMLVKLAKILLDILPEYSKFYDFSNEKGKNLLDAIFIEGHTDNIPVSNNSKFQDNWDLSAERSINTYKILLRAVPELTKYLNGNDMPLFSVAGYADQRPVADNKTLLGRELNRRIDLRFIMSPPKERPEIITILEEMSKYETIPSSE